MKDWLDVHLNFGAKILLQSTLLILKQPVQSKSWSIQFGNMCLLSAAHTDMQTLHCTNMRSNLNAILLGSRRQTGVCTTTLKFWDQQGSYGTVLSFALISAPGMHQEQARTGDSLYTRVLHLVY